MSKFRTSCPTKCSRDVTFLVNELFFLFFSTCVEKLNKIYFQDPRLHLEPIQVFESERLEVLEDVQNENGLSVSV